MTDNLNAQQIENLATQSLGGDAAAANVLAQHAADIVTNPDLIRQLNSFNPTHDPNLPSFTLVDERGGSLIDQNGTVHVPQPGEVGHTSLVVTEGNDRQTIAGNGRFGVTYGDKLGPAVLNTVARDNHLPEYNPHKPTIGK